MTHIRTAYEQASSRLLDIVHADQKLYLVFEFLDVDLKRYMENGNKNGKPIQLNTVKVSSTLPYIPSESSHGDHHIHVA